MEFWTPATFLCVFSKHFYARTTLSGYSAGDTHQAWLSLPGHPSPRVFAEAKPAPPTGGPARLYSVAREDGLGRTRQAAASGGLSEDRMCRARGPSEAGNATEEGTLRRGHTSVSQEG